MTTFKQYMFENQNNPKLGDTREWVMDAGDFNQVIERYWDRLWAPSDNVCKSLQHTSFESLDLQQFNYLGYLLAEVDEGDQIGLNVILKVYEHKPTKNLYVYVPYAPEQQWWKVGLSKDRFMAFLKTGTIWSI